MSSFMCCPETLYTISGFLYNLAAIEELHKIDPKTIAKDLFSVQRKDIFSMLYNMNKKALIIRYEEDPASEMIGYEVDDGYAKARQNFEEDDELENPYLIMYKLDCYLYQCGEGPILSSKLYLFLKEERKRLAEQIVRSSQQYQDISIDEWN